MNCPDCKEPMFLVRQPEGDALTDGYWKCSKCRGEWEQEDLED